MKTINVGVIGWGFMGKTHTQALRSIPLFYPDCGFEINLKCICSRRIEKAQEAMKAAGFECCTDDYRELLAMEDIDVVSICTPNDQHEEMAIAAAKAGKHVYLDKPIAVTGKSAMRIAEACVRVVVDSLLTCQEPREIITAETAHAAEAASPAAAKHAEQQEERNQRTPVATAEAEAVAAHTAAVYYRSSNTAGRRDKHCGVHAVFFTKCHDVCFLS